MESTDLLKISFLFFLSNNYVLYFIYHSDRGDILVQVLTDYV